MRVARLGFAGRRRSVTLLELPDASRGFALWRRHSESLGMDYGGGKVLRLSQLLKLCVAHLDGDARCGRCSGNARRFVDDTSHARPALRARVELGGRRRRTATRDRPQYRSARPRAIREASVTHTALLAINQRAVTSPIGHKRACPLSGRPLQELPVNDVEPAAQAAGVGGRVEAARPKRVGGDPRPIIPRASSLS